MANILGTSKHNLTNADPYTAAEKEIIKAMSLKEVILHLFCAMLIRLIVQAKAKCAEMQRMRALMSYREAKFKRQKKIKSKQ